MKVLRLLACCVVLLVGGAALAADLPLTRVVLFTSGVGYFEREGAVQGDATVELTFRTEQINDLLKSLVVQGRGTGNVAPVTYASQEPLERTLGSFAVNLADNPSLRKLWDRLRGAKVRLTVAGATVEGTAFGSEERQKTDSKGGVVVVEVLNLMTHEGLRQFPVADVKSVKVLDAKLEADLEKALAAIDKARDTDHKPVTLTFRGQGERQVKVGYLLETPVWKTTYRLVNDPQGLFLQGWALVENTTDDDWSKIGLALVSGRPVSFTQNLYEPLYLPRPDVPVQVAAAARPRVYQGAMEQAGQAAGRGAAVAADRALRRASPANAAPPAPGMAGGGMGGRAGPAGPEGQTLAAGLALNLGVVAEGGQVGTLFQYAINQPVSIPRQRSAMIPIISERVQGEKVSVYTPGADPRHPMNGIRLRNSSKLHLMGGPITVFDGNTYAGDALIEDIPPGDERLLTYAMDLDVEVEPQVSSAPQQLLTARLVNRVLTLTYKQRLETVYNVRNKASEKRTVLIEHPLRPDWKLVEPAEAQERTRSAYRFQVPVEPGKTAKLVVAEETARLEEVALTGADLNAVRLYVSRTELSEALRAALRKLVDLQDELAALAAQRTEKETRLKEIEQEQARIRDNMRELDRGGELYKQYVEKLTKQETDFDALRGEVRELRGKEAAMTQQIAHYIAGLTIE
jgi:hypothetical protein